METAPPANLIIPCTRGPMFAHVPVYPGDPILSLLEAFQADSRATRANLSIGLYYDDDNSIPVLASVREAAATVAGQSAPHTYLPMEGMPQYRQALQRVVFGADSVALRENRVATIQSVGGSGALRIGAEFLKAYFPGSEVWVSDPTWDNHEVLFAGAGLAVHAYPYYDPQTNGLRFGDMLATIDALPARSVVLLQPCCHNPTGIDLSRDQWRQLIAVLQRRELIPFVDMAYQASATDWTRTRGRSARWSMPGCRLSPAIPSRRISRCMASVAAVCPLSPPMPHRRPWCWAS